LNNDFDLVKKPLGISLKAN
jgi:hypothetical protein